MATNDELTARYPELLDDAAQADRELIETVRALDALYAMEAPAQLDTPVSWQAGQQTKAISAGTMGTTPRPIRHEVNGMHMIRTTKGRRWAGIASAAAACLVVGLLAALLIGGRGSGSSAGFTQQGKLRITALTGCASPTCSLRLVFSAESSKLTHRFADVLGVRDVRITLVSDNQLSIELPGVTDENAVVPLLAQGNFAILDTGGTYLAPGTQLDSTGKQYPVVFRGTQVDPASVNFATDPFTGQKDVTFAFADSAEEEFARYTAEHIGQYLTIALDGTVIESAIIQSVFSGTVQLTGLSQSQTRLVAAMLKYGPLAVPFRYVVVAQISSDSAVVCGATPPPTPYPASTPTPPPDATPSPPTPTPWPNPTPIPTGTPASEPGAVGSGQYTMVLWDCGTATPAPGNLATPTPLPTR